ncbi:MAG: dynamin family protein, partial [Clostridia bacterium]|nr:dynamin family protein [Clostridia bacterium]
MTEMAAKKTQNEAMLELKKNFSECREKALNLYEGISKQGPEFSLPEPMSAVKKLSDTIKREEHTIVVMGEVSRGKSSWINGLIGKELLPTDPQTTTSQAFCIRSVDDGKEAFRVRYEDDSYKEITKDELTKYGSQLYKYEGEYEDMTAKDVIRWIEIDTPCKFIPRGLRIIDTPGLGSVYAGHSEITRRFIPHANGVVFVFKSDVTVLESEVGYIEEILSVTPNILFIQTHIDVFQNWEEVRKNNEDTLRKKFREKISMPLSIWPVSNKNMLLAGEQEGENRKICLNEAKYPGLAAALDIFFLFSSGAAQLGMLIGETEEYFLRGKGRLQERLDFARSALSDMAGAERRRKEIDDKLTQLQKNYGAGAASVQDF